MKLLALSFVFVLFSFNSAFCDNSFSSSSGTSQTRWAGMRSPSTLQGSEKQLYASMITRSARSAYAVLENTMYGQTIAGLSRENADMPIERNSRAYKAKAARLFFQMKGALAESEVVRLALLSRNRGPISLSDGTSESKGHTFSGATGGSASSTNSRSSSYTSTTCEENLKWKGWQMNCQTGMGNGAIDGIKYEFDGTPWQATKIEGIQGPVRWSYQSGVIIVEHRAKGTVITFDIRDDAIRVVSADNLVTFKRDAAAGNLLDTTSQNMTRKYVDLWWQEFSDLSNHIGNIRDSEWEPFWAAGNHVLLEIASYVDLIATRPDLAKKHLDAAAELTPAQQVERLNGDFKSEWDKRMIIEKNGKLTKYNFNIFFENNRK